MIEPLLLCPYESSLFSLALGAGAFAQTWRGSVTGIVSDPSQARIPAVGITLTQEETNRQRVLQADAQGEYTFGALPPGTLSHRDREQNFRTQSQQFTLNLK